MGTELPAERGEVFTDDEGVQPYKREDIQEERGVITTPYDAPVRTLIDEIREKVLVVNPPFQRRSVWRSDRQSKLIESLLLNIPIPVLYFAEDEDGTRVVVDGQQRLRAIEEYHAGQYKLSKLEILADLNGKRWADLTPKQSRAILSRTLRCVVISASSSPTLRFEMFERLNTGGIPLNDQEVRNCVIRGRFNNFLNDLVSSESWLSTVRKREPDKRLQHHEMALRFFAIGDNLENYRPPLKKLLSDYMRANREIDGEARELLRSRFESALTNVRVVFGDRPFRRVTMDKKGKVKWDTNLNRAVFDVQMLSLAAVSPDVIVPRAQAILERFRQLCLEDSTFLTSVSLATADRKALYTRLNLWADALQEEGIEAPYLDRLPEA